MLKNKKALSPKEQEVYFALSGNTNKIFTAEMLKDFRFTDYNTLKELLSSMSKKGWLTRIKKGVYYLNEPGSSGIEDIFKAATYLYNGYVAFSSALYLYHAITERPYTVYVATRTESKSKILGGIEVKAVAMGARAVGVTKYEGYVVSTRAKTLYDCFHIPDYAGGYGGFTQATYALALTTAEWGEFLVYIHKFDTGANKVEV